MDNRITKNRLSNFLSYEWILILIMTVVAVFVLEFVYTVASVRLSTGQQFKIYYDQNLFSDRVAKLYTLMDRKQPFSYDVLKLDSENLSPNNNVLSIRLSIQDGDVIFTDSLEFEEDGETKLESVRAKEVIDANPVYTLDNLLIDAKTYLRTFLENEQAPENAELDFQNLSLDKISNHFLNRMKKDNRFRSDEQKADGIIKERERIEKLCRDVKIFQNFLNTAPTSAFYTYTKYEQLVEKETASSKESNYQKLYQREKDEGRENARYGINVSALKTAGKTDPAEYFKVKGKETADNVVLMAFNFIEFQPDLQFECISFISMLIEEFTGAQA